MDLPPGSITRPERTAIFTRNGSLSHYQIGQTIAIEVSDNPGLADETVSYRQHTLKCKEPRRPLAAPTIRFPHRDQLRQAISIEVNGREPAWCVINGLDQPPRVGLDYEGAVPWDHQCWPASALVG